MATEEAKKPDRKRRTGQELANRKNLPIPALPLHLHQDHPAKNQHSDQRNPVGQRHEKPIQLVPLLHSGDPVPTIFPVHRDLLRIFFAKNIHPVTPKSSAVLPMERKANQVKILISASVMDESNKPNRCPTIPSVGKLGCFVKFFQQQFRSRA